jgi:1-acyl-sn-glycerol-3-phosphate acyltransferase
LERTFFDTPILKHILRFVSLAWLRVFGWKAEGEYPSAGKFVLIAAPHTSNWDMPYILFFAFYYRAKIYWMGKHTIFKKPFGTISRWMGGIPIDRSKSNNVVQKTVEQFNEKKQLVIAIPPTGTRKKVLKWKTGFYYIALQAKVPIALGFLDYKKKIGGIGPLFYPTGDIEADMSEIMSFYEGITGKNSDKYTVALPDFKISLPKPSQGKTI